MAQVATINPASTMLPQDPYPYDVADLELDLDLDPDFKLPNDFGFDLDQLSAAPIERPSLHDKRKVSNDSDSDDEEDGGGGKRQEGADKVPKKPGRKPVVAEPSTVSMIVSEPPAPTQISIESPRFNLK